MSSTCYCTSLRAAARRLTAIYDEALQPAGVSTAQFALMRKIATGQPLTLTELGRRSELDRSTVGRNVRLLETLRFVALSRGEDQREASVTLTDEGRRVLAIGDPLWTAAQTRVESALGPSVAEGLRAILNDL